MTSTLAQTDPPRPAREALPTMYDLPSEEIGDPGMPDEFHVHQAFLLDQTFRPPALSPDEIFSAVDMNLYFNPRRTDWYKRPDWFAVIGVPRLYEGRESRLSYVAWQEPMNPLIIVELLSPRTEKEDLGQTLRDVNAAPTKWEVYSKILRVPYYVVFGRKENDMRVFRLDRMSYEETYGHDGRLWVPETEVGIGLWRGKYKGQDRLWLRWYDVRGNWIPTPDESVEGAMLRAEQEHQRAEQEHQRAERLAEALRQLGHNPDQL